MQTDASNQVIDDPTLDKIFESMVNADRIIKKAKQDFPSSFFFDIEPPHQIFAKALNIDDLKMAEALVNNLMRNNQSELDKAKFKDRVMQLYNDQVKLYYDCYSDKVDFPLNCIEHLIKLWLKRNGVITFDPMAQKSYIQNLRKQIDIKSGSKMNKQDFTNLLKTPQLKRLLDRKMLDSIDNPSNNPTQFKFFIPQFNFNLS